MVGGDGGKGASLIQTRKWMCSVERPDTPTFSHVYAHKDPRTPFKARQGLRMELEGPAGGSVEPRPPHREGPGTDLQPP